MKKASKRKINLIPSRLSRHEIPQKAEDKAFPLSIAQLIKKFL